MRASLVLFVSTAIGWEITDSYRRRVSEDKITGGEKVNDIKKVPYAVSVQIDKVHICGGNIVSKLWVATACSCVTDFDDKRPIYSLVEEVAYSRWGFVAGTVRLNKNVDSTAQYRKPSDIKYHPKCEIHPYKNFGLAMAKMVKPFDFNEYVKPVKIFSDSSALDTELKKIESLTASQKHPGCTVGGWGSSEYHSVEDFFKDGKDDHWWDTTPNPPAPKPIEDRHLKITTQYFLNSEDCLEDLIIAVRKEPWGHVILDTNKFEKIHKKLLEKQICSYSKYKNESACRGDSGGGFVCNGFLFATSLWNYGCGAGDPGVYQNLLTVFDWFKSRICSVRDCQDAKNLHEICKLGYDPIKKYCVRNLTPEPGSSTAPVKTIAHWLAISIIIHIKYHDVIKIVELV